jgi:hypothetical protein
MNGSVQSAIDIIRMDAEQLSALSLSGSLGRSKQGYHLSKGFFAQNHDRFYAG